MRGGPLLGLGLLLLLAAGTVTAWAWRLCGPNVVRVRNATDSTLDHVDLLLPGERRRVGPLQPGATTRTWFRGSDRQGLLLFEAVTDGRVRAAGCIGEYLDTFQGHRFRLDVLAEGTFIARMDGDDFPQEICATETAAGSSSWRTGRNSRHPS